MSRWLGKFQDRSEAILSSDSFFRVTIALFVLQAGIVAILSGFPLAFDEGYHLGVIQLHALQWSPFFGGLPESSSQFGALATEPSYLYHYALSFVYKFISIFTQNSFVMILILRFISIAVFAAGIAVFRKLFVELGVSKPVNHFVLLVFAFLPLTSFTAGQINYSGSIFLMTALTLLYLAKIYKKIKESRLLCVRSLLILILTLIIGVQIQFTYLLVAFPAFIVLCVLLTGWLIGNRNVLDSLAKKSFASVGLKAQYVLLACILLSGVFGVMRYGYNLEVYGAIVPKCEKVLDARACMAWGPWARNYNLSQSHVPDSSVAQQKAFVKSWIGISGGQLFAVLNSNKAGATEDPFEIILFVASVLIIAGLILLFIMHRKIIRELPGFLVIVPVCVFYLALLIFKNYSEFIAYGIPVAIQARYLLPVLLVFMVLIVLAYSFILKNARTVKYFVVLFVIIIGVQGGGAITYLARSDETWGWAYTATQSLVSPVDKPDQLDIDRPKDSE